MSKSPKLPKKQNELPKPRALAYLLEDYHLAPSGEGPLASEWEDKPHRLLYDLIAAIRAERSGTTKSQRVCFACNQPNPYLLSVGDKTYGCCEGSPACEEKIRSLVEGKHAPTGAQAEPYWKNLPDALRASVLETHYLTAKECLEQAAADRDYWKKAYFELQNIAGEARKRAIQECIENLLKDTNPGTSFDFAMQAAAGILDAMLSNSEGEG